MGVLKLAEGVAGQISQRPDLRVCLLLGASDTGKTTFLETLVEVLVRNGSLVVVVDSDVGQSHLGPPTTIGWGKIGAGQPFAWQKLEVEEFFFTGSTSPSWNPLVHLAGLVRMVERARLAGSRILVDTTGLISGLGVSLKLAKIEALNPDLIIGFEREKELSPILDGLSRRTKPEVIRFPVPFEVGRKAPERRAAFRAEAFARYFAGSRILGLNIEGICWWEIPSLGFSRVGTFSNRGFHPDLVPRDSLLSLRDDTGRDLALGLLRRFDQQNGKMLIQTPLQSGLINEIKTVAIGAIRLNGYFFEI